MQTRPAGLIPFGPSKVSSSRNGSKRTCVCFGSTYRTQGFPSAEVGPPRATFSDDRTRARIVVPVVEGTRRMVPAVTVTGNHVLGVEPILKRSDSVPAIPGTRCEPRMPDARWSSSISGAGTAARSSG